MQAMVETSLTVKVESLKEGALEGYAWWKIINDKYMVFHNWEAENGNLRIGDTLQLTPLIYPVYRNCSYEFVSKLVRIVEVSA